ncbi:MAG: hypothetical protein FJ088_15805, partial [Deltaproteobacteria bacterium]|nr:hypothetical protein [Deltaproteobacteria bacterium]
MRRFYALILTLALAAPSFVFADEGEKAEVKSEEKKGEEMPDSVALLTGSATAGEKKFPIPGFILLEQTIGLGTFVEDTYARNAHYHWLLSIRPRYFITDKLFAEIRFDLEQELTASYGTSTTKKRQLLPSDTLVTFKYQNLYTEPTTGINISPFMRFYFPTSYESRFRDLYFASGVGFDLTRFFNPVFLTYTFRFVKNFNKHTVATLSVDDAVPVAFARTKGSEG